MACAVANRARCVRVAARAYRSTHRARSKTGRPPAPCRSPVRTAPDSARSRCTSARAAGPVIHWLSPLAHRNGAIEARSDLDADPRPACRHRESGNPGICAAACSRISPWRTTIPRLSRAATPVPRLSGFGSSTAKTTSATPASMRASGTGRRTAMMGTGFQRDVRGRALRASPASASR